MTLSPTHRHKLSRIVPFGIIWFALGVLYSVLEKGIIGDLGYYPSTFNPYSFRSSVISSVMFAGIAGLILGFVEVQYLNRRFMTMSRLNRFLVKLLIYFVAIFFALLVLAFIGNSIQEGTHPFDQLVLSNIKSFMGNFAFVSLMTYLAFGVMITLFYTEVSMAVGAGVLSNFFTGRYHVPIEEQRIFMFLDMKSSTTIAEQLGHQRYFELLKQYYIDISAPVIEHRGTVYQYVGDEMVLTWLVSSPARNADCIQCFYAMRKSLESKSDQYRKSYGIAPTFKAGIHCGKVTTGEIGEIKRDIVFTGDVLNSAARIQGLCNTYEADLLVSADFIDQVELPEHTTCATVGTVDLRGRDQKMGVYKLTSTRS